jgi:hypothetical protein
MLPAVGRLLGRIWANLLSQLGTTTTAVVMFSFLLPILGFALALVPEVREGRKSGLAMAQIIKDSILSWPTIAAASLTVFAWLGLFGWISVRTVYREHQTLVADNGELKRQIESLQGKNTDLQQKVSAKAVPAQPHHPVSSTSPEKPPLASLSDGQRFVLKKKLTAYKGHGILLVFIGHDSQMRILYEQLIDIFNDSGWTIQRSEAGQVGVAGMNFPNGPHLTSTNIGAPIVKDVFSVFSGTGVNLPLMPDAFGAAADSDMAIVIH